MQLKASQIGKRYKRQVVIKPMDVNIHTPGVRVILGGNGSGKSTLMKMLAGMLSPSKGKIVYLTDTGKIIPPDKQYRHIAFAGPYHEVVEEMRLREFLNFTTVFRPFRNNVSVSKCIELMGLTDHSEKLISEFSSGMKQKLKLALALYSDADMLFLDEPVSHLDAEAIRWYQYHLSEAAVTKIVFVASNHNPAEYPNAVEEIFVG
jgi:ABC-type multidrug transport system ATPase subunit